MLNIVRRNHALTANGRTVQRPAPSVLQRNAVRLCLPPIPRVYPPSTEAKVAPVVELTVKATRSYYVGNRVYPRPVHHSLPRPAVKTITETQQFHWKAAYSVMPRAKSSSSATAHLCPSCKRSDISFRPKSNRRALQCRLRETP